MWHLFRARVPGVHRVEMVVHPSSPVRPIRAIREPRVSGPGEGEGKVLACARTTSKSADSI